MDKKNFDTKLDKIFCLNESLLTEPQLTGLGAADHSEDFRNGVKERLRGLKKSPKGTPSTQREVRTIKERENPISVGTIQNQVKNFGPEALGQIIGKLNPEMDKVDANGQPTSEYNQFIDAIKQDGLEIILKTSAGAGGVKMAPAGGKSPSPTPESPAPGVAPKEPGQELANL